MKNARNRMTVALCGLALTTLSAVSEAGWVQGRVSRVYAGPLLPGAVIAFKVTPSFETYPREGRPACATFDEWAVDTASSGGQRTYELLLEAQRQGYTLEVFGTGTCNLTGDREDLRFLYTCLEQPLCLQ